MKIQSISVGDGLIHLVEDSSLPNHSGCYIPASSAILHGGTAIPKEDGSVIFGERTINPCTDRSEFVACFAEQCEGWTVLSGEDIGVREIQSLLAKSQRDERHLTIKVRIERGTALYDFPRGPWLATPQGILDAAGALCYTRSSQVEKAPEVDEQKVQGLFSWARKRLGGKG